MKRGLAQQGTEGGVMARKRVAPALRPSSTAMIGPLVRRSMMARPMATSRRRGEFSGDDAVDFKGTEERGGGGKEEGGKSRHSLTDERGAASFSTERRSKWASEGSTCWRAVRRGRGRGCLGNGRLGGCGRRRGS